MILQIRQLARRLCHGVTLLLSLSVSLAVGTALAAPTTAPGNDRLTASYRSLLDGRLQDAITSLHAITSVDPHDARAQLLLCRAYFAEEQTDQAVVACEAAVQLQPRSSEIQDWLGRAYGRKADHASPLAGFQLARKVRDAFEAAVQLDPHSAAAANDLGEYYVNAPQVVGGGLDRANAFAARIQPTLPQQAHRIFALAAEKRRDFGTAEREYAAAADAAPSSSERAQALVDLALYYQHRRDADHAVEAIHRCLAADRDIGAPSVDAASILIDLNRESALAERILSDYLAHGIKTDAAPVPAVHLLLSRLYQAGGDRTRATMELNQALQLAPDFQPARRALQS